MGTVTLQTLFQDAFPLYEPTPLLPSHVRRAARALMQCRTAARGGHVQACPDGHMARRWSNACRHRSCPQGADLQTARWLALQQARLLACAHSQVMVTLPHALPPLWLANVPVMSGLLVPAARATGCDVLGDPTYLGAQPGISAALPTWSQPLVWHPPVQGVGTGGGLTPDGHGQAVRNGLLRPVRGVMAVWRGKRLDAIRRAWMRGALVGPEVLRPQQGLNRLNRLGHPRKTRGHGRIMERDAHGAGGGRLWPAPYVVGRSRARGSSPGMASTCASRTARVRRSRRRGPPHGRA
jgi:hypothetical protein